MNILEKISALLTKEGRTIKYGEWDNDVVDPLICLAMGESKPSSAHIGDGQAVSYPMVIVSVISSDYIAGFNLIETLKTEIKSAIKSTIKVVFTKDSASERKESKYVFKSHFKQIVY